MIGIDAYPLAWPEGWKRTCNAAGFTIPGMLTGQVIEVRIAPGGRPADEVIAELKAAMWAGSGAVG